MPADGAHGCLMTLWMPQLALGVRFVTSSVAGTRRALLKVTPRHMLARVPRHVLSACPTQPPRVLLKLSIVPREAILVRFAWFQLCASRL